MPLGYDSQFVTWRDVSAEVVVVAAIVAIIIGSSPIWLSFILNDYDYFVNLKRRYPLEAYSRYYQYLFAKLRGKV